MEMKRKFNVIWISRGGGGGGVAKWIWNPKYLQCPPLSTPSRLIVGSFCDQMLAVSHHTYYIDCYALLWINRAIHWSHS